jgi:hypothetical protein
MDILKKLDIGFGRQQPNNAQAATADDNAEHPVITNSQTMGKDNGTVPFNDESADKGPDAPPDPDAQRGIQKIEAVTSAWSKWSLAALLFKYVSLPHFATLANSSPQYLDHLSDQRVSNLDSRQSNALCDQRLPISFAADRHWDRRRLDDGRMLYSNGEAAGRLGSC